MTNQKTIKTSIPLALGVIAGSTGLASRLGRCQVPGRQFERVVETPRCEEMRDHPQAADSTGKDR